MSLKPNRSNFHLDAVLRRTVFVFAVLALVLVVFVAKFANLTDPSAADYAQLARNFAQGKGLTTSAITPLSLSVVPRLDRHPELTRPPLYVLVLAVAMRAGGATDRVVALTSTLFLLASLLTTYLVARRHYGDQVGLFAVVVCLLSVPLLTEAVSGLETTLLTFLVTLLFGVLFAHQASPKQGALRWPLAAGLLLGLCYLTRYEAIALVPAVLAYFWFSQRRRAWRPMLITVGVLVVVVAPWVIRSSLIVGRPFVTLHDYELVMWTDFHPMQTLHRAGASVPASPWRDALWHPADMLKKANQSLQVLYGSIPQLINPFAMPFLVLGLVLGTVRNQHALPQWIWALAMVLTAGLVCLYMPMPRLLLPFTPIGAVVAVAWFGHMADEYLLKVRRVKLDGPAARFRFVAWTVWMLLLGYPLASYLFTTPAAREHPLVEVCQELGKSKERLIATDIPTFVSWYGEKVTVLLPSDEGALARLGELNVRPDLVYLSPLLLQMPLAEGMGAWQKAFLSRRGVGGFQPTDWKQAGMLLRPLRPAPGASPP